MPFEAMLIQPNFSKLQQKKPETIPVVQQVATKSITQPIDVDYFKSYRENKTQNDTDPNQTNQESYPNSSEAQAPGRISEAKANKSGIKLEFEDPTNYIGNAQRAMDLVERLNNKLPDSSVIMFGLKESIDGDGESVFSIELNHKDTEARIFIPTNHLVGMQSRVDRAMRYLDKYQSRAVAPKINEEAKPDQTEKSEQASKVENIRVTNMVPYSKGIKMEFSNEKDLKLQLQLADQIAQTLNNEFPTEIRFQAFTYSELGETRVGIKYISKNNKEISKAQLQKIHYKVKEIQSGDF
jgi:hypothetical protein